MCQQGLRCAYPAFDVHMHHEKIDFNDYKNRKKWSEWQKLGLDRYCSIKFWIPFIDKNLHLRKKWISLIKKPLATRFFAPFSSEFPCFVGDHSFCANRKAANYLLKFHSENSNLESYYRRFTIFPPESYYHTIFCNAPNIRVENNNWRYIDWSISGDPHPKTLQLNDLPKIKASSAHFARKFDIDTDSKILDELDTMTE